MSNCNHVWSTNSGRGGEPKFPRNFYSGMNVHCKHCDERTAFKRGQWMDLPSKVKSKLPAGDH